MGARPEIAKGGRYGELVGEALAHVTSLPFLKFSVKVVRHKNWKSFCGGLWKSRFGISWVRPVCLSLFEFWVSESLVLRLRFFYAEFELKFPELAIHIHIVEPFLGSLEDISRQSYICSNGVPKHETTFANPMK